MRILATLLAIGLGIAAAVLVSRMLHSGPEPAPLSAPAGQPAISGNYADDWQSKCGPLTGTAQTDCTAGLDGAYGRKADMPVPKN